MVKSDTAFRKYVEDTGSLPDSVVLGQLSYFTITEEKEAPVAHADVEKLFAEFNLNPEFVPLPNRPADAYKKATKDAERPEVGRSYPLSGGRKMNLLVRDVATDKEKIVRHLIRELVDSENVRLAYDKVGEAIFYHAPVDTKSGKRRASGHRLRITIDFAKVSQEESDTLEGVRKRILDAYNHDCLYLDGMKLRAMVREYVLSLNAVQLKPSLYFVHKDRGDELRRLAELIDRLNNGSGMHLIPMVDLPEQRREVIEKFQEEASSSLQALLRDIEDAMTRQVKVTPETYRRFHGALPGDPGQGGGVHPQARLLPGDHVDLVEMVLDRMMELQSGPSTPRPNCWPRKGKRHE